MTYCAFGKRRVWRKLAGRFETTLRAHLRRFPPVSAFPFTNGYIIDRYSCTIKTSPLVNSGVAHAFVDCTCAATRCKSAACR